MMLKLRITDWSVRAGTGTGWAGSLIATKLS